MLLSYRGSFAEREGAVKVNRSERDALIEAGITKELAAIALEKGKCACGRGEDCCLGVEISESDLEGSNAPYTTFDIRCTEENCTLEGVVKADVEIIRTIKEIAGI